MSTIAQSVTALDVIPGPRLSEENGDRQDAGRNADRLAVLHVDVDVLSVAEALSRVVELMSSQQPSRLVFANASCVNIAVTNERYRDVVRGSDLVLNDGVGLDIAARFQGARFPANLNGTDFTPEVLRIAARLGQRVYLLGGQPGVAERARQNLEASIDGLNIVGSWHGYATEAETSELIADIRSRETDLLIVGMGAPVQELWLDQHLAATGARLGMAVGAFIDFSAGNISRAPEWIRRARMEWGYRLAREPIRLSKRYIMGNPVFIYRVSRDTVRRLRDPKPELRSRVSVGASR